MKENTRRKLVITENLIPRIRAEFHGGLNEYMTARIREETSKILKDGPASMGNPVLVKVSSDLSPHPGQLLLTVSFVLDYFFLYGTRTRKKYVPIPDKFLSLDPEHQYQFLCEEMDKVLDKLLIELMNGLPTNYGLDVNGKPKYYPFFSEIRPSKEHKLLSFGGLQEICSEVFKSRKKEFLACVLNRVSQAHENIMPAMPDDLPGHYPGTPGSIRMSFSCSDRSHGSLSIQITMTYKDPIVWSVRSSMDLLPILALRSREKAIERVNEVLSEMVETATEEMLGMLPFCQVIPGAGSGEFPEKLYEFLTTGTAAFPHVKLLLQNTGCDDKHVPFLSYSGNGKYSLLPDSKKLQPSVADVVLDAHAASKEIGKPLPLTRTKTAPANLLETYRYCLAISSVILKEASTKGVQPPDFILSSANGVITSARHRDVSYTPEDLFGDGSKSLRRAFNAVLEPSLMLEQKMEHLDETQLAALNELNETELAILRLIHQDGRTWRSMAEKELSSTVVTKRQYIGDRLDALCERKILTSDGSVPLLRSYTAENAYGDAFYVYKPLADLCPGVLDKAVPRAFRFDEISLLNSAKRGAWFVERIKSVETRDERWEALQVLENDIQRTFLQEFVKSPEGESFFRSFSGPDATYARLLLGSIPGCKKYASVFFGDEQG